MNSAFKSVQDAPDIPISIQMHMSMWTEEFKKFKCRDLCAGGKLYENPELINATDFVKRRIKNGQFNVIPISADKLFKSKNCITGYICVTDSKDGMVIHHTWEDVRK